MKHIHKIMCALAFITITQVQADDYARSIFVPRQLAYNPILENALTLDAKMNTDWNYIVSVSPIYTQSVGSKLNSYFLPCHKSCLNIQEDGSGDVSSLWFNVISSDSTFYSSTLSLKAKQQKYGALFYAAIQLPCDFQLSLMTAFIQARNKMDVCESGVENLGTCGFDTVAQSLASCSSRCFGRIGGTHTKAGVDDIQIKALYSPCNTDCMTWDVYGLLGIPTGRGSKAKYLFEPLVGSKHAQLGFGSDMQWNAWQTDCGTLSVLSEVKYRYAFRAKDRRSFDLKNNCQWSRYMLFVDQTDPYAFAPAINSLTFNAKVTPGSSLDLYLATHFNHKDWNFELGYDLWYRSAEKISVCCKNYPTTIGIADLRGIAAQGPFTASTANIAQGVQPGINQIVSDTAFVPVTMQDIAAFSGAQARSLSNSFYASVGYKFDISCYTLQLGANVAYEQGSLNHTPNNVMTWLNMDLSF